MDIINWLPYQITVQMATVFQPLHARPIDMISHLKWRCKFMLRCSYLIALLSYSVNHLLSIGKRGLWPSSRMIHSLIVPVLCYIAKLISPMCFLTSREGGCHYYPLELKSSSNRRAIPEAPSGFYEQGAFVSGQDLVLASIKIMAEIKRCANQLSFREGFLMLTSLWVRFRQS